MGCICGRYKNDPDDPDDGFVAVENFIGSRDFLRRKSGRGQYYYENGDMYDGQWENDKKHGYGCYTYANGDKIKGYFNQDEYVPRSHLQPPPADYNQGQLQKHNSAETLPPPPSVTKEQLARKAEIDRQNEERRKQNQIRNEKRQEIRENIRKKWLE